MKRSRSVELVLVLSATSMISACNSARRRCVDANNIVVYDNNCSTASTGGATAYHWYYGGSGSRIGSRAIGGSTTSSGTSHGVFGGAGEAHGAGGST